MEIRARVTGYIVKVNFEDGQNVKKGELLFEIDPRPYQAVLDRAQGELARLEAVLEKAKADLARSERLRPSGAVSQDEYEQHVAQLKIAKASIASAKAAVRGGVEPGVHQDHFAHRRPRQPHADQEGNLVSRAANDSAVLTTVVTTNPIYVYFNVDEHALLQYQELAFQTGQALHPSRLKDLKFPVEIGLANEEGFPHAGILDFADNKIDRSTGTIRVRGVFENANEYLTPGLFVRVRIPFGKPHQALLVSERAIGTDQRQKYLLTVNKENVVEYRQVKVGPLAGRPAGDRIGHRPGRPGHRQRIAARPSGRAGDAASRRASRASPRRPPAGHGASKKAGGPADDELGGRPRCSPVSSSTARSWPPCRRSSSRWRAWRRSSRCRWRSIPRSRRPRSASPAPIPAPAPRWWPTRWPRRSSSRSTASRTCSTCRRSRSNDGTYQLTVTFKVGTDLNMAQVLVQNRVALAMPTLPDVVKQIGVTTMKRSPDLMMIVNLISPDGRYDQLYLSNYALIQVRDEIARLEGVGDAIDLRPARLQHARLARSRPAGHRAT